MVYNTGSAHLDLYTTVSAEPSLVVCGRDMATKQRLTLKKANHTWDLQSAQTVCHRKQLMQQ